MVPKNSNERQFVCSRHRSSRVSHFGSKLNEPTDPHPSPRNNLFEMNGQDCDRWSPTASSNDQSDKCSCSQPLNSYPSIPTIVHPSNRHPVEAVNRTVTEITTRANMTDEVTVIKTSFLPQQGQIFTSASCLLVFVALNQTLEAQMKADRSLHSNRSVQVQVMKRRMPKMRQRAF